MMMQFPVEFLGFSWNAQLALTAGLGIFAALVSLINLALGIANWRRVSRYRTSDAKFAEFKRLRDRAETHLEVFRAQSFELRGLQASAGTRDAIVAKIGDCNIAITAAFPKLQNVLLEMNNSPVVRGDDWDTTGNSAYEALGASFDKPHNKNSLPDATDVKSFIPTIVGNIDTFTDFLANRFQKEVANHSGGRS